MTDTRELLDGLPEPGMRLVRDAAARGLALFAELAQEAPIGVFVSEQQLDGGEQIVSSIWIWSDRLISEVKRPFDDVNSDIDFILYQENISYAELTRSIDVKTGSTRLAIIFGDGQTGNFTATGENQARLTSLTTMLISNLVAAGTRKSPN